MLGIITKCIHTVENKSSFGTRLDHILLYKKERQLTPL